ncbi:MAG: hypothetical protein E7508_10665 [Ruminococcus sp.]|nr:hypothetical protein [Ruminococcus sp.]
MTDISKLYENAGEMTRDCLDDIINGNYLFIDDDENYTKEYLLEYNFKTFGEGLTDFLVKKGFGGNINSANEKTMYIKNKSKEKNVNLNPAVVKTWFAQKRPVSSERSREAVYKLCFSLGLTAEETADFFLKVYYECPFNFRIYNELIYYYCLNSGKSYAHALYLTEKADEILKKSGSGESVYEFTTGIGTDVKNIHTDTELLDFISKNSAEFNIRNKTAYWHASKMIDECTELAVKSCKCNEELQHKIGRKGNIDLFIYVLFGENISDYKKDMAFSMAAEFPDMIKDNFPLKMNLSKIKNGKRVSYETMRKALIMLSFYSFFENLFQDNDSTFCVLEEDFTEFVCETNDLLYSCGYPILYARNPYDWLFMHCGYCEYPLEEFKNAVARYYLDKI